MEIRATEEHLAELLTHSEWLLRLARTLVADPAAADDLVQETWIAVMRNPPDRERPARPWLAGVIRKLALLRARGEGRRRRRQEIAAKQDELPSTTDMVESLDTQRRLAEVVLTLAEPYRSTVMLRYYQGFTAADISRRLDVPAGTVRWRLKHGMDELRERLDSEYEDRRAWSLALVHFIETSEAGKVGLLSALAGGGGLALKWAAGLSLLLALFLLPSLWPDQLPDQAPIGPRGGDSSNLAAAAERVVESEFLATRVPHAADLAPRASFRIIDESGVAQAGVEIVLLDGTEGGQFAVSDDHGHVEFNPWGGEGELFMHRPAALLQRTQVNFDDAPLELTLRNGLEVAGRLLVDGSPPPAGTTLSLVSNRPYFEGDETPKPLLDRYRHCRRATCQTDEQGFFQLRGLHEDWTGLLELPPSCLILGEARQVASVPSIALGSPTTGLLVEATRIPCVIGRVVSADASHPITRAEVEVRCTWDAAKNSRTTGRVQRDGTFELLLPAGRYVRGSLKTMQVTVVATKNGESLKRGRRTYEFTAQDLGVSGPEPALIVDLGDMRLAEEHPLRLLVKNAAGEPIVGAAASSLKGGRMGQVSDERGLIDLVLSADEFTQLVVAARGHQAQVLDLGMAQGASASLQPKLRTVVLETGTELRFELTNTPGMDLHYIQVWLSAESDLFSVPVSANLHALFRSELEGTIRAGGRGPRSTGFYTNKEGHLDILGLRPGQSLRLDVRDGIGRLLHTEELAGLSQGEQRTISLHLDVTLNHLSFVFQDTRGELVVGAGATIESVDGFAPLMTRTDEYGRLDIPGVLGGPVNITSWKKGFARIRLRDIRPMGADRPHRVVLQPGLDMVVYLADHRDKAIGKAEVVALDPESGARWVAVRVRKGLWRFTGLYDVPIEIRASVGERVVQQTVGAGQTPSLKLRLPPAKKAATQRED